jgi:hypothetical protein
MSPLRVALVSVLLAAAAPATAAAGTVTQDGNRTITYESSAPGDNVTIETPNGGATVRSELAAISLGSNEDCTQTDVNQVDCDRGAAFVVQFSGGGAENQVSADGVTTGATLDARGGNTDDRLYGTPNADRLSGDAGDDNLGGGAGNDVLDGGPGANSLDDGPGDDTVIGGPQNDSWTAGPGRDTFTPGDGTDSVSYEARTAPVTITLDGVADDGEAGEGDNVGADVEEVAGGAGSDVIIGNALGDRLHGRAGDDTIVGGIGEDRLEGEEGNDTIEARDGRFDSIDCGPGYDVVYADLEDSTENCEVAPDVDGDGFVPPADCDPLNPAINPGAGEIVGNAVDEDCQGGPLYLRVVSPIGYLIRRRPARSQTRFTRLVVSEVQAGDRIELRCTGGKRKGCPFTKKTRIGQVGKPSVNLVKLLKKRWLHKGAVLEIRVLRANQIGRVQRLKIVRRGLVKGELLCLAVGASTPAGCT